MTWNIETTDRLSAEQIEGVLSGVCAAIRVPHFCCAPVVERLTELLLSDPEKANYRVKWSRLNSPAGVREELEETDTERIGPTDSNLDPDGADYCRMAAERIRRIRDRLDPYMSPIDRLRLELDEIFPHGARLHTYPSGAKAMAGVGRLMRHSAALIHADAGRAECLTANVYLKLPAKGGTVSIWDHSSPGSDGSYLFEGSDIPSGVPSVTLLPAPGDLIIWNPSKPHVIHSFADDIRLTMQVWLKFDRTPDGKLGVTLLN